MICRSSPSRSPRSSSRSRAFLSFCFFRSLSLYSCSFCFFLSSSFHLSIPFLCPPASALFLFFYCTWDSNPYALLLQILSLVCLPFHHYSFFSLFRVAPSFAVFLFPFTLHFLLFYILLLFSLLLQLA